MSQFRYVAISPDRVDQRKQIGPASFLHDFLVDHQTDPEGKVNYGKAISYAWIRSHWQKAPPVRTLQRHMARLRSAGHVLVRKLPFHEGMKVRVLGSAKWPQKPAQIPLFPVPEPVLISTRKSCGKAVNSSENRPAKSGGTAPPKVAGKSIKNLREEKTRRKPLAVARSAPVENPGDYVERWKLLQEQYGPGERKFKTSC